MSTASAAFNPVQQSLAALRAGQESFARFVLDFLADMDAMQQKLLEAHGNLREERRQLAEETSRLAEERRMVVEQASNGHAESTDQPAADEALQAKVAELEQERAALEEELESVRSRAVGMAQSLAEQKKQMAEEHAEWAAELRQLRRILDKQAAWISQHAEMGAVPWAHPSGQYPPPGTDGYPNAAAAAAGYGRSHPAGFPAAGGAPPRQADPVVGSLISQFELLQKDVARRKEQSNQS